MKKIHNWLKILTLVVALLCPTMILTACGGENNNNNSNNARYYVYIVCPSDIEGASSEMMEVQGNRTYRELIGWCIRTNPNPGYTFDGLYSDSDFTSPIDLNQTITQDVTVYVKYRVTISADIIFNCDDETHGTVSQTSLNSVPYGTEIKIEHDYYNNANNNIITVGDTVITATPATGYEFMGWLRNGENIYDYNTKIIDQSTLTYTAVFEKIQYTTKVFYKNDDNHMHEFVHLEYGSTVRELKQAYWKKTYGVDTENGEVRYYRGTTFTEVTVNGELVDDDYVLQIDDEIEAYYNTIYFEITGKTYGNSYEYTPERGTITGQMAEWIGDLPTTDVTVEDNVLTINGKTYTAMPKTGYHFIKWGVSDLNNLSYKSYGSCHLYCSAYFGVNNYTVTVKDNLGKTIATDTAVPYLTTFENLQDNKYFGANDYDYIWKNLVTATVNGVEIDNTTQIISDTEIVVTYKVPTTVSVMDNLIRPVNYGSVSATELDIMIGDTFIVNGNTLTVGNTTITADYDVNYINRWRLGNRTITNGMVYDGAGNTIVLELNTTVVTVDLTTISETEKTIIKDYLGEDFSLSLTEYVPTGITLTQLSDKLQKYGLTLSTVALSADYQEEDIIDLDNDSTTAITGDTTIYVITCEFNSIFTYVESTSGISHSDIIELTDSSSDLEEIYIPVLNDEKTYISSSFSNYSNLITIIFGGSATIDSEAFSGCNNLKTIIFGDSATIRSGAFSGCNIENIYVPSLEVWLNMELSNELFPNGVNLYINNELVTDLEITSGMTIGDYAFAGCNNLQNVTVCSDVTTVGVSAFKNCTNLKTITFAATSDINIANDAFNGCSELTTLTGTLGTVGDSAFENCTKLTGALTINGNIGNSAFNGCTELTTLTGRLGAVGNSAFNNCTNLTGALTITGNIGFYAFSKCSNLISVTTGSGVTIIDDSAFYACSNLTSITISNGLTSIGNSAFEGCSNLTNITIPDSVTYIGECAFYGCSSLTSITIPDTVTYIENNAFYGCSSLTSITIPNSVTNIGGGAFYGCSSLTSIKIPYGVDSIDKSAFYGCSNLTSITIPDSVTEIGSYAFYGCSKLTNIKIPDGVTRIGSYAFYGCSVANITISKNIITKSNSLKSIGDSAFYGCSALTDITLGDSLTSIGEKAFYGCSALTDIMLGNSLTSIGWGAFYGCNSLSSITIPDGVTEIGTSTFKGCSALTDITLSNNLTSIGSYAFYGCSSLTSITIPDSVTSIGEKAFYGCSSLTSITIPDGVTKIDSFTFDGCSALTDITLSNNLTSIGNYAFYSCSSLTSITIPDSVTRIGSYAFYGCTNLKNVYITDIDKWCQINFDSHDANPLYNGANLFLNDELVTELVIPDSVTSIGNYAFYSCSSLTSITIPDTVTYIGNSAFEGCSNLTNITISNGLTSIGNYAFEGCSSLTSITIPNSVTSIGWNAFDGCSSLTSVYYCGIANEYYLFPDSIKDKVLYYSEIEPTDAKYKYWHYDTDGNIVKW